MRLRTFLGWMLALGLAGCGGGGASSPVAVQPAAAATGKVALTLDLSSLAESVGRKPEFIGAGVTGYNFIITRNGSTVTIGSGSFATCPAAGPCSASSPASPGTGLMMTVNVTNSGGSTLGTGSTTSPFDITAGASTPVSVVIGPKFSSANVTFVSGTLIETGSPQSAMVNVKALDPASNVISTSGGPVPNWPSISLASNDTSGNFTMPAAITTAPATTAGDTLSVNYNGNAPSLLPGHPTLDLHAVGSGSSNTIAIPVVWISSSPAALSVDGGGENLAVTVTNSSAMAFGESDNCTNATVSAPTYAASGPSSVNMTATYTVTATAAFTTCTIMISQPAVPGLVTLPVTVSGPGSLSVTPQDKREKH